MNDSCLKYKLRSDITNNEPGTRKKIKNKIHNRMKCIKAISLLPIPVILPVRRERKLFGRTIMENVYRNIINSDLNR